MNEMETKGRKEQREKMKTNKQTFNRSKGGRERKERRRRRRKKTSFCKKTNILLLDDTANFNLIDFTRRKNVSSCYSTPSPSLASQLLSVGRVSVHLHLLRRVCQRRALDNVLQQKCFLYFDRDAAQMKLTFDPFFVFCLVFLGEKNSNVFECCSIKRS